MYNLRETAEVWKNARVAACESPSVTTVRALGDAEAALVAALTQPDMAHNEMTDAIDWKARAEAAERERDRAVGLHDDAESRYFREMARAATAERSLAEARSELAALVAAVEKSDAFDFHRRGGEHSYCHGCDLARAVASLSDAARARDEAIRAEGRKAGKAEERDGTMTLLRVLEHIAARVGMDAEGLWEDPSSIEHGLNAIRSEATHALRRERYLVQRAGFGWVYGNDLVTNPERRREADEALALRADKDGTR